MNCRHSARASGLLAVWDSTSFWEGWTVSTITDGYSLVQTSGLRALSDAHVVCYPRCRSNWPDALLPYVKSTTLPPTATVVMGEINKALGSTVCDLSDQNYALSLAFFRFWLDVGQTYPKTPPEYQIFDVMWNNRVGSSFRPIGRDIVNSGAHLFVRLASDVESDHNLAAHSSGLQNRLCTRSLQEFFNSNLGTVWDKKHSTGSSAPYSYFADTNLIAHWANLGQVEETTIRNHILQSLLSHSKLYDHQADALIILFKIAGATFEAYVDPSVVNRCFELLKNHYGHSPVGRVLVQVRASHSVVGGYGLTGIQEVVALRERGWEGLPPPPLFKTGKPKPTDANQTDPATPVVTTLGLPNRDPGPQIPQPPPLDSASVRLESTTISEPPVTPVVQSPSISVATLSDFTIADVSDDEPSVDSLIADTSDDELPFDPTAVVPHKTFYLEDGNVEVLCGNSLFRVTVSTLSFHSPMLRQMFARTNLATAESPNGCPRILSSDSAKDFTTLLKVIYLPGFDALPKCC